MEHTNCGENCAFVKSGFCKCDKECPFYVETWWKLEGEQDPKIIKDCFPQKFTLEQNHLLHRQMCSQSVVEDVRNRMDKIESMLENLISQSKEFITEKTQKEIDLKSEDLEKIELKKDC